MKKSKKPEQFIKTPGYPGGNEALNKFIKKELRYPKEAIENKIEGTVVIKYDFNENGKVIKTKVEHGIGHGCDEEAQRIVKKMRYPKVKNKGVRVTFHSRINIHFRLKDVIKKEGVQYNYTTTQKPQTEKSVEQKPRVYSYNIKINNT